MYFAHQGGGEAFMWGCGQACGNKRQDILAPEVVPTEKDNVIAVTGEVGRVCY